VTKSFQSARPNSPNRSWLARLRKLFWFLRTVDVDQIGTVIAEFDARQRRLEQAQRDIEAVLLTAQAGIDAKLAPIPEIQDVQAEIKAKLDALAQSRDAATETVAILDIKNLGYEIGRRLAEENLSIVPTQPDYSRLRSKVCTQDDFATDWLRYWCGELHTTPYYHRKIWELCYVAQALFAAGKLVPGSRGLGFGCGEEPLPSLFAKYGVRVLATDLEADRPEAEVWRLTDQHASTVEVMRRLDICPDPQLLANIEFRAADMNAIPPEFDNQFDFCWSACALEHLGSLDNGLTFIERSLRTLKVGGVAVHTTEFTFDQGKTIDNYPTVLYQQHHLLQLTDRLRAKGYEVAEFDFSSGSGVLDRFVDLPPFTNDMLIGPAHYAHLKLLLDGYTCTSVGIIIIK
jgi:SAM-dependent methyltransferase